LTITAPRAGGSWIWLILSGPTNRMGSWCDLMSWYARNKQTSAFLFFSTGSVASFLRNLYAWISSFSLATVVFYSWWLSRDSGWSINIFWVSSFFFSPADTTDSRLGYIEKSTENYMNQILDFLSNWPFNVHR
jgi:hypothetical protein